MKPDAMLYLSDSRGIYIPRDFARDTRRECISGVDDECLEILKAGPDHEFYWEAWEEVCGDAVVTDPASGIAYTVYQDGDCFLVPEGMEWSDESGFYWPEESAEDC